jgi:hypothetical protein
MVKLSMYSSLISSVLTTSVLFCNSTPPFITLFLSVSLALEVQNFLQFLPPFLFMCQFVREVLADEYF